MENSELFDNCACYNVQQISYLLGSKQDFLRVSLASRRLGARLRLEIRPEKEEESGSTYVWSGITGGTDRERGKDRERVDLEEILKGGPCCCAALYSTATRGFPFLLIKFFGQKSITAICCPYRSYGGIFPLLFKSGSALGGGPAARLGCRTAWNNVHYSIRYTRDFPIKKCHAFAHRH